MRASPEQRSSLEISAIDFARALAAFQAEETHANAQRLTLALGLLGVKAASFGATSGVRVRLGSLAPFIDRANALIARRFGEPGARV